MTYWSMSPGQTPTSNPAPGSAVAQAPLPKSSSIITLPPDTFAADLAETQRLLEAIESNGISDSHIKADSDINSDKWHNELHEVQGLLD